MNKEKTIIIIGAIAVLFFGTRQILKPKEVYQQPVVQTQTEPASLAAASSTTSEQKIELPAASSTANLQTDQAEIKPLPKPKPSPDQAEVIASSTAKNEQLILMNVPFTSQAPFARWSDPRQQYGCEEASSLMAVRWAEGLGAITKAEAEKEIFDIVAYEERTINNYYDTSASDTLAAIIKGYFNHAEAELRENSDIAAIKAELVKGNVLILPMDGKKLKNPNFNNGGPDEHMIVIRGYDPAKKEFITNDPGTRKGEGYRYPEKIVEAAWRDYPSGDHLPIAGVKKNMIIVQSAKD